MDALKKFLKSLSSEQWVYLICAVGAIGYGLNMWVGSMTSRNTSTQNSNIVVSIDQKAENNQDSDDEKRKLFRKVYKNLPLPDGSKLTPEEREEKLIKVHDSPYDSEDFSYSILVPKGWRQSASVGKGSLIRKSEDGKQDISFPIMTTINKYYGPAEIDMIPFLKIELDDLKHEVTADTLLSSHLSAFSISPMALKIEGRNYAEALYVDVVEQDTFIIRTLYMINGKTATYVTIGVPIDTYKEYGHIMGAVISSFKYDKEPVISVEETERFSVLGTLSIDYFPSWKLVNVNDDSSLSISFQLYNRSVVDETDLNGLIEIKALRINKKVSVKDTLEAYHKVMGEQGIIIKDIIESSKIQGLEEDYNYAVLETYKAELVSDIPERLKGLLGDDDRQSSELYFQLATINNGNYIVFVSLLGVSEEKNAFEYGRNLAHFDKIVKTMKIRVRN